ncbi:MAG: response regulator transcription factor [bacterium]
MSMDNKTILLVDDDQSYLEMMARRLENDGYHILQALEGDKALELAKSAKPDCIILDYMMPGKNGLEVCRDIRSIYYLRSVPIIILTGHSRDKVGILMSGADYFLSKSGDTSELMATLTAVFRRQEMVLGILRSGDLTLNPTDRKIFRDGQHLADLTPKTFTLLYTLVERSPQAVSKEELFRILEGDMAPEISRALDVLVNRLRKAVGTDIASRIHSVKGYGYTYLTTQYPST